MDTYNWDKAEIVKVGSRGTKAKIIVRNGGWIHLNSAFVRENNIQDRKFVKSLIIKEGRKTIIGFIFIDKKEENTWTICFGIDKKNAGFSGRSVFAEAGIDTSRKKLKLEFEPKVENYNGSKIYVIEVKKD